MVLAMQDLGGRRLDELAADELGGDLLDDLWRQVHALHRAGLAHRSLRAANILVTEGRPVLIDFGRPASAASARMQAIDRAELLASLAASFGAEPRGRLRGPASSTPTTSPPRCRTCSRWRCRRPPARRRPRGDAARPADRVAEVTARDVAPLERLVRVRPRTIFMIATLTGAFYVLLPQLANVDDSVEALRSANWLWLAGAVVMSALTYVASAIGIGRRRPGSDSRSCRRPGGAGVVVRQPGHAGQRRRHGAQRPLPAEGRRAPGRGGHRRRAQRPGRRRRPRRAAGRVPVARRATGRVGVPHPGQQQGPRRHRRGPRARRHRRWRRVAVGSVAKSKVVPALRQSFASIAAIARSPGRLSSLLASSAGVTLAYICALASAIAAFDGGVSFAQVGAVYLGASVIAAAAPTPGGLGAMEAALVAGFTGVGMDPAIAVAAVLSYRLVTYWLPVLPGWLCFRMLERRNYI